MNIYSFSVVIFSAGVFLISILALLKRRDSIAMRFFLFSISVCGWGFIFSFWITQNYSPFLTLLLIRISYFFVVFIPITWLHFVLDFIGKKEPFKFFYLLNYLIATFFLITSPTPFMFSGLRPFMELKYSPIPTSIHHLHLIVFFILVPYGLYQLIIAYMQSVGPRREQLKYLVIGTVIGFMSGSTVYLAFYGIPFPLILLPLMPLYPILTGIALIRYGLFDPHQIADAFQREKLIAIGTLATSINHELRNPLFIAKGKIESQLDAVEQKLFSSQEEENKNNKAVLDNALQQLSRAMEIMQRLSDFAKPYNGRGDKESVVLKETFENVLQLVSNEFQLQKIRLRQTSLNGLSVSSNRRQLEEIFFNLILNACQAMGEKGGELSFDAYQKNGSVMIEITDSGPGISKEDQRRIFEPFYSTKGEKGTGLGLYITKQLVERNGGKISVKSKVGQGTTFVLEFKR